MNSAKNEDKNILRNMTLTVLVAMLAVVFSASTVTAGPFHGGHHGMFNPLEKLIDHIDLTDQQEEEIEKIFADLKEQKKFQARFEMMKGFALLDPDDPSYSIEVEERANKAADEVKSKIIEMNNARKAIYDLLDPEQKEELNKVVQKKIAKMEKRIAKRF